MDNLVYLLEKLMEALPVYKHIQIPDNRNEKRKLLRSLMNILPPQEMGADFFKIQDEELQAQRVEKGVVDLSSIKSTRKNQRFKLWQGDITRLNADAIVNAANSQLLGCFVPLHRCIDNAIHSAAGIQLRLECNEIMKNQGSLEPTGTAKITSGYNLPAKYVLHTVGPIIKTEKATTKEEMLLASCYRSCLQLAAEKRFKSLAFCCISTGEFRFPNQRAAEIAISTVEYYFQSVQETSLETIVFNVYKDLDLMIYEYLLGN